MALGGVLLLAPFFVAILPTSVVFLPIVAVLEFKETGETSVDRKRRWQSLVLFSLLTWQLSVVVLAGAFAPAFLTLSL